jgi:L-seryl-tRNA(Ser) seleniumtransferase
VDLQPRSLGVDASAGSACRGTGRATSVVLDDMQNASGEYIARRLRCEGAMVTSGAAGALTLATAACIAAADGTKPDQIPERVVAMKCEVIVQKAHRYEFEHAM